LVESFLLPNDISPIYLVLVTFAKGERDWLCLGVGL
jgi:hypothetical protein